MLEICKRKGGSMWEQRLLGVELYYIFYNFILYGFFGWIYESIFVSVKNKRLVNRGFLNGPIIPLYGAGATIVYVCLHQVQHNYVIVFLGGMVIATILEYVTSFLMEVFFHAKWWDYSHFKFNIKGRICLMASAFWGMLSIIMVTILQPFIGKIILSIPRDLGKVNAYIILLLFLIDICVTIANTIQLDHTLLAMKKIKKDMAEYLEGTRWYAVKEEWKSRLEHSTFLEWMEQIKEVYTEKKEGSLSNSHRLEEEQEENLDLTEETEQRLRGYWDKYQKHIKSKNYVKRRLLRAFPNMKAKNRESEFKELKDKILEKRKK